MRKLRFPFSAIKRHYSSSVCRILGIETSCDDTGVAVVDSNGSILGESLISQQQIHLLNGGILPPLARDLHSAAVEGATKDALTLAKLEPGQLDAVAVTSGPGLPLSLLVGLRHAKQIATSAQLPLIPIHHMEAHALTARINSENMIARRLKLANLSETRNMVGGRAIEYLATKATDPLRYSITEPLLNNKDCNFSFSGIKNSARKAILSSELEHEIEADATIPGLPDLCAAVQLAVVKHLSRRLQRAIEFLSLEKYNSFFPNKDDNIPTLVVSGGVASNSFIKSSLSNVCSQLGWRLVAPPPKLCTDNGVMIAWNGVERYLAGKGLYHEKSFNELDVQPRWPLGEDAREVVAQENIKCKWIPNKLIFPTIYSSS